VETAANWAGRVLGFTGVSASDVGSVVGLTGAAAGMSSTSLAGFGINMTAGEFAGGLAGGAAHAFLTTNPTEAGAFRAMTVGGRIGVRSTQGLVAAAGLGIGLSLGTTGYCTFQCVQNSGYQYLR